MGASVGKEIRLGRILDSRKGRACIFAFDHGLAVGPIAGAQNPQHVVRMIADAGADAILLSPGLARTCRDVFRGRGAPGMILRIDWTNTWRTPGEGLGYREGRTRVIASVEEALAMGADAVITYLFVGYDDPDAEADQLAVVGRISRRCEALGMPHIIEAMARGGQVDERAFEVQRIALVVRMAGELGADLIKTDYSGEGETFRDVIRACFVPVLIAGGPRAETVEDIRAMAAGAMRAGAAGIVFGRNVFQAERPAEMFRELRRIVFAE